MLLSPDEGGGEHLPGLLHVEIPGPKEAEDDRVGGGLVLLELRHALLELDEPGLLHGHQLAEEHLDVVLLQLAGGVLVLAHAALQLSTLGAGFTPQDISRVDSDLNLNIKKYSF